MCKFIITEEQYSLLLEQRSDYAIDRQSNAIMNATGIRPDKDYNKVNKIIDTEQNRIGKQLDTHTLMTIAQIGTAFIPFVGPFISAGIGLADAAIYYNEGDKKTAGLVGLFSIIPGIGGLASKMGLGKVSSKVLASIGKKIGMGAKLTNGEVQVANKIAQNRQLLQAEISKLSQAGKSTSLAKQGVKSQLKKQAIKKSIVKTGAPIVGYGAAGAGYSVGYDKLNPQQQLPNIDLNKIDIKNVSQANKDAALNVKW
jgi:hypothetical protein